MNFPSQSSFVFLFFITLTKFSFACENWSDHATDVIKLLNVSLTSDPGKTPSTNGLAYITVNGKNYAPQTKGFNVAVFDHLSGLFLTSAAFDCAASQAKCNELGIFLSGLPQDTVVLIAIQESGLVSGRSLPTSQLEEVGIQSSLAPTVRSLPLDTKEKTLWIGKKNCRIMTVHVPLQLQHLYLSIVLTCHQLPQLAVHST